MSLALSLANASSEPDSSIAKPSLASFTLVTFAFTRRCFNAASSLASVVVPAMTPMFLPPKSVNFCNAVPLTRNPPPSRKISDEKSTSSIRVIVAVVLAQSISALPEATIASRSATVPTIQLTLSSDTPAARPNCWTTRLQRSIE